MKTLKMGLIGFVLGAVVAVGSATVGSEETVAAPCCSTCEEGEMGCLEGCGGDAACESSCAATYARCYRICSFSC